MLYPPGQYPITDQPVQADEPLPGGVNYTNNIAQWAQFDPCNDVLNKIHGMFGLPAFNYTVSPALDMPYAVLQYNFIATGNFIITGYPVISPTVNYVPVIRYTDPTSGAVVRYKLWEIDGDSIYYPLYDGQWIAKTFCIEIWCVYGQSNVLQPDTTIQFQVSRTQTRTNPTGAGSYTEATPAQVINLFNTNAGLTLPLVFANDAVETPSPYVAPPIPSPTPPTPPIPTQPNWRISPTTGEFELYNTTTGLWNPINSQGAAGQESIVIQPQTSN